jgi:hypothetical protein
MKPFATMVLLKCMVGCAECTGMLKMNSAMKCLIGNSIFLLSTKISERLGI